MAAICEENYAAELRAFGIYVRTSAMGSLRSMSQLLRLPNGVEAVRPDVCSARSIEMPLGAPRTGMKPAG